MSIMLNGKVTEVKCPITIKNLLSEKEINQNRVVVEVNFEIILKKEWEFFQIQDDDQVEVLQFVGGG